MLWYSNNSVFDSEPNTPSSSCTICSARIESMPYFSSGASASIRDPPAASTSPTTAASDTCTVRSAGHRLPHRQPPRRAQFAVAMRSPAPLPPRAMRIRALSMPVLSSGRRRGRAHRTHRCRTSAPARHARCCGSTNACATCAQSAKICTSSSAKGSSGLITPPCCCSSNISATAACSALSITPDAARTRPAPPQPPASTGPPAQNAGRVHPPAFQVLQAAMRRAIFNAHGAERRVTLLRARHRTRARGGASPPGRSQASATR